MQTFSVTKYVPLMLLAVMLLASASMPAATISFTGQFDPSLATVVTGSGSGWFDASGAPSSITLWGSDSGSNDEILTQVLWTVVTGDSNVAFFWNYRTLDAGGPSFDPAGWVLNGVQTQLSDDSGATSQGGFVSGISLSPGDQFGFYVDSLDDIAGAARITISGEIPEPATVLLCGFGLAALGLFGRRRRG